MGNQQDVPAQDLPQPVPLHQFTRDRSLTLSRPSATTAHPDIDLIAAAFSAALDRPVVTRAEFNRRKGEPLFANAECLSLDTVAELCYEPAFGKCGNVYGENGATKIDVCLRTLSGRSIPLVVGTESYVEELKYLLEEREGIPVDYARVVLLHGGKQMQDGKRISEYGVDNNSIIDFTPTLRASGPSTPLILDNSLLSPGLDYDFAKVSDEGKEFYRGGMRYYRPCGWRRIALNVEGKYQDNAWLGRGGTRTETCAGEWPVSYHGTLNTNAESIAKNGYDITKRKREKYGQGIYSSPCIKVAEDYAKKFSKNNKKYKVVFQNRVSPSKLKIHSTSHGEYWLQPDDRLIRPYGLCIKELDNRQ